MVERTEVVMMEGVAAAGLTVARDRVLGLGHLVAGASPKNATRRQLDSPLSCSWEAGLTWSRELAS